MSDYGVTKNGFELKRMDTIIQEIHADLTEGFGVDTTITRPSLLDTLVTTFAAQIAGLWEVAQDSYYAKYPSTATGINLDNVVQFGGIRRKENKPTVYSLHVKGEDGTVIAKGTEVASNTKPEIVLRAEEKYTISRSACNEIGIVVISTEDGTFTVTINGISYSYEAEDKTEEEILQGLKSAITNPGYVVTVADNVLIIKDTQKARNNKFVITSNLTTSYAVTIANYETEDNGIVKIPNGVITKVITFVSGLESVTNLLTPTYGQAAETDVELRQSYLAKAAVRSYTMLDSIIAELLNNVEGVTSASGYENDLDVTSDDGLPPHSIELVVEGGDDIEVAEAILKKKAGGIQTFGNEVCEVPGKYGDTLTIRFNRPVYLYTWIKVRVSVDEDELSANYEALTIKAVYDDTKSLNAGDPLLTQMLTQGIYQTVSGITFINIYAAYSTSLLNPPSEESYVETNIYPTTRQMLVTSPDRIEVVINE